MFGVDNIHTLDLVIDADPAGGPDIFYLTKLPHAAQVIAAYMTSDTAQNAGTATLLQLENWGTAGAAIKSGAAGTVVPALGGTAVASRLSAQTPVAGTPSADGDNIAEGEWLVVRYTEEGAGWVAGDRLSYHVHFVYGVYSA